MRSGGPRSGLPHFWQTGGRMSGKPVRQPQHRGKSPDARQTWQAGGKRTSTRPRRSATPAVWHDHRHAAMTRLSHPWIRRQNADGRTQITARNEPTPTSRSLPSAFCALRS